MDAVQHFLFIKWAEQTGSSLRLLLAWEISLTFLVVDAPPKVELFHVDLVVVVVWCQSRLFSLVFHHEPRDGHNVQRQRRTASPTTTTTTIQERRRGIVFQKRLAEFGVAVDVGNATALHGAVEGRPSAPNSLQSGRIGILVEQRQEDGPLVFLLFALLGFGGCG